MPNSPQPLKPHAPRVLLKAENNHGVEITESLWSSRYVERERIHAASQALTQFQAFLNAYTLAHPYVQPPAKVQPPVAATPAPNHAGLAQNSESNPPISLGESRHGFYKPNSSLNNQSSGGQNYGASLG